MTLEVPRGPPRKVRLTLLSAVIALALLLAVPVGMEGWIAYHPAGTGSVAAVGSAPAITAPPGPDLRKSPIREDIPYGTGLVYFLASHGRTALFSFTLFNYSTELAVFDGRNGTITPVQVLSGGFLSYNTGIVWTGDKYLISNYNGTSGLSSFETYSSENGIRAVHPNVGSSIYWSAIGTAGDYAFISTSGYLIGLNDETFHVARNFSSHLPSGVAISAVAMVGNRLFVGGTVPSASGGWETFYGFIDLTTRHFTQLSPNVSVPSDVASSVVSIVVWDGRVFFGGYIYLENPGPNITFATNGAVLEAYNLHTGHMANLSRDLPPLSGVVQLVPLGDALGIVAPIYEVTWTGIVGSGGFYVIGEQLHHATNETSVTGLQFLVGAWESSVSGGLLFMGGGDLSNGETEMAAFNVGAFCP